MQNKIDLETIIHKYTLHEYYYPGGDVSKTKIHDPDCKFCWYEDRVLEAMKEACRQTLELAAQNAKVIKTGWKRKLMPTGSGYKFSPVQVDVMEVDKHTILNVIKQIE